MAQRDQIDIFVAGASCAGKSTVVAIIRKALTDAGFSADQITCVGDSPVNEEKVSQVVKNGMTNTRLSIVETTYGQDAKPAKEMNLLKVGDKLVQTEETSNG